jgi:transcriptional regulator with XRE-family HTH domain
MLAVRRANGWTIKEAARHLGVDEGAWGRWERTAYVGWPGCRRMVEELLADRLAEAKEIQRTPAPRLASLEGRCGVSSSMLALSP